MGISGKTIGWGILGAGTVAHQFALGLRLVSGSTLVAVASRSQDRAEHFAAAHGVSRSYTDYSHLVANKDVDVVYIATPNHCHKRDALLSLQADKAVVCEKPFALDVDEAHQIVHLARQRRLFCMEGMWMRFLPLFRRLDELLKDLGEVTLLTSQLGHAFRFDPASRLFSPKSGGGATLDLGVYLVSLAVQLFGEPLDVVAQASIAPSGVDEHVATVLRFADGRLAALTASLRAEGSNDAVILANRGRIRIHAPLYCPDRLSLAKFSQRDLHAEIAAPGLSTRLKSNPIVHGAYRRLGRLARKVLPGAEKTISIPYSGNGYNYEASHVVRCLREGRPESEVMPLDETLTVMRTLDAIRKRVAVRYPTDPSSTGRTDR